MSYLKIFQNKIQQLTEDICSALNVDITVVDENLVRIAGTGNFYNRINKNCPEGSLFQKILEHGKPEVNIKKVKNSTCANCSDFNECKEKGNMAYPIKVDNENLGVVSFAAFDDKQGELMNSKSGEYFKILQQIAGMIEKEIINIKITNRLNMEMAQINEIINSINKGIFIINSDNKITHINEKALKTLGIDISKERIMNKRINSIIKNINIEDTRKKEVMGEWEVKGKTIKVLYEVNEFLLNTQKMSTIVSFDELREIINIAMSYTGDDGVGFQSIIGKSESLLRVIEKAKIAALSDATILLQGESGTGKELFARAIHNASPRRNEPFIAVNCASIPENLIESELFGYEKGAFTGANAAGKVGKFELANNGTLFLDEIADLPLHLQPKLLRVLQQKEIIHVGGNKPIKINARIISATHVDLSESVKNKAFRQDLYYRINVIPLKLPSLKERKTDILLLSEYILKKYCQRAGINEKKLSKELEQKFMKYEWYGNIRELENVLEYAATFSSGEEITFDDLPDYFSNIGNNLNELDMFSGCLDEITNQFQKKILTKYLELNGNTTEDKKLIAEKLGISLATLYRKLQEYNL